MELRVSTLTGICKFSKQINLNKLYEKIKINDKILFIECGINYKGAIDKKNLKKREKSTKKFFYNQCTLHVNTEYLEKQKKVNVKLFNNGSIQMTGLKTVEMGQNILDYLLKLVIDLNKNDQDIYLNDKQLSLMNYDIAMYNTDFDIGFKVNREKLNRYLINLDMYTSYEPCIYPGVIVKYYYKKEKLNGICNCGDICKGDGKQNNCKKVTIAVFNSGKIIITGGKNITQCKIAYDFIYNILMKNKNQFIDVDIKINTK
jgi:TATA-box binding protein (TBP) (component of TFIID and TFIIIB)